MISVHEKITDSVVPEMSNSSDRTHCNMSLRELVFTEKMKVAARHY